MSHSSQATPLSSFHQKTSSITQQKSLHPESYNNEDSNSIEDSPRAAAAKIFYKNKTLKVKPTPGEKRTSVSAVSNLHSEKASPEKSVVIGTERTQQKQPNERNDLQNLQDFLIEDMIQSSRKRGKIIRSITGASNDSRNSLSKKSKRGLLAQTKHKAQSGIENTIRNSGLESLEEE